MVSCDENSGASIFLLCTINFITHRIPSYKSEHNVKIFLYILYYIIINVFKSNSKLKNSAYKKQQNLVIVY